MNQPAGLIPMTEPAAISARIRSLASSVAVAALLLGAAPLAAQEAATGEVILQQEGVVAPDPNAAVDPAAATEQPVEGQVVEDEAQVIEEQPLEGQVAEDDPQMTAEQPVEGQVVEGEAQVIEEQLLEGQVTEGEPLIAEQPTDGGSAEGDLSLTEGEPVVPAETDGAAAVPSEGELQPSTDEAEAPAETGLLPAADEASAPQEELLPAADDETAAETGAPAEGELLPAADEAATPAETELLPAADEASVPQEELLPPPEGELAAEPAAEEEAEVVVLDPDAPRVQQQLPAGMVRVILQNVSAAPVDVFVDPMDGSAPQWVMTINPGFQVVQPIQVGQTWRLAQHDQWMGGFVPSEEAEQRVTFAGAPL